MGDYLVDHLPLWVIDATNSFANWQGFNNVWFNAQIMLFIALFAASICYRTDRIRAAIALGVVALAILLPWALLAGEAFAHAYYADSEFASERGQYWFMTGIVFLLGVTPAIIAGIRKRRPLVLMLGDTSMGMINGYFGPRLLSKYGFAEHKIDQAWIIDRGSRIAEKRIADALAFVKDRGVTFHYGEPGAEDGDEGDAGEDSAEGEAEVHEGQASLGRACIRRCAIG